MIKGDYFGKLLKQLFSIGLISCFTLLVGSSVSAYFPVGSSTSACIRNNNGKYSDLPCENDCSVNNDLSISCSSSNSKLIFTNYANGHQIAYFRTPNGLARYYVGGVANCGTRLNQSAIVSYLFTGFQLCEGEYYPNSSPNVPSCPGSGQILSYFEMLNYVKSHGGILGYDYIYYHGNSDDFGLAFIGNNYYFQSVLGNSTNTNIGGVFYGYASPYNLNVSSSCTTGIYIALLDKSFSNVISNPMRLTGGGSSSGDSLINSGFVVIGLTGEDYLDYFENNPNYNFNKNICYVGTNDLTTTGISGIPYYEGSGKDIVQLFAHLYGNTFTTKNLGSFLNTWNINYGTWYLYGNRDELGNPLYNAYYSLNSGFYLDYSDNLTNPFLINPTAIYFMASIISDYGSRSTLGEEIATYCYYKLQRENPNVFDGINITDNHDSSYDKNVLDFKRNWGKYSFTYSGENIQAMSWDGTDVDYFSGDSDLTFEDFFTNAFNKFRDSFSIRNEDLGAGFLPTYIIMFLLALVLFRFISH